MRARQGIATLVAGAGIVAGLLAAFAVAITHNQSQSKASLEHQAHQRTELVASLIDAGIEQQARIGHDARIALSRHHVAPRELSDELGEKAYAALIGASGMLISHTSGFTAQDRRDVDPSQTFALLGSDREWAVSDVRPGGVINVIARVAGGTSRRALVTGVPLKTLSQFVAAELGKVPGVTAQHQIIVDGQGLIIGSTVADRPSGYRLRTPEQRRALHMASGIAHSAQNGTRYFDSVALGHSNWKLIISVPVNEFFASVDGLHHWLPWIILVAFGLVALAALWLVWRAMEASRRIRVANARLSSANTELESAHARLEQANGALARSNTELERQARELVRSNTELDQFAQVASHDLQEPLRKVRTFTERITETEADRLSERGADYLRRANAAAERMQTLIEDLLRFSRVTTQGREFAPVDLGAVMGEVLDDLSEMTHSTGAQIEVGPLPTVRADSTQMRQLLQNLISNALKFRREDVEPHVRVQASTEAGWLTLTIADNGIGFDPQYATRIFRVFERLHGRAAYPGTGIGLALCRKIAERHGGTVVADGVPDEGATFTVTLQTDRTGPVTDAPEGRGAPERESESSLAV